MIQSPETDTMMPKATTPDMFRSILLLGAIGLFNAAWAQPGIDTLGIPPNATATYARGLSPEGTIVAGNYNITDSTGTVFIPIRWTPPTGVDTFAALPGSVSGAILTDAASNGSAFSGLSYNSQRQQVACRWTAANGITSLGFLPNGSSSAAGWISDDGLALAGTASTGTGQVGFHWTQAGGMVAIGDLPGGQFYSTVEGMSGDGQTVVGWSFAADGPRAFRWTPGGGLINMGVFPGYIGSTAMDVSGDGSVIVGSCTRNDSSGQTIQAFRWTAATGLQPLGWLPGGRTSRANLISADGSVIVGGSDGTTSSGTFIWRNGTGMVDFRDYLMSEHGIDFSSWLYFIVDDISADGTTFTGIGRNAESRFMGWRIKLGALTITSPEVGARWVVDQCDTVRWQASGVEFFSVDLSSDDGATWRNIDFSVTPGDSQFVYNVPDTLTSGNRYRVRVSDLFDTTRQAVSERFTVKGYDLFRVLPDSSGQVFQSNQNGWAFRNDTTTMWPRNWYRRFIYLTATDPYTNERYPGDWYAAPITARSPNFPDWPNWVEAFGEDAAYWSTFFAVYKDAAVNKWRTRKHAWGGSCYGLAVSSLLAWSEGDGLQSRYPVVTRTDNIFALPMSDDIRKAINQYFIHQYGRFVLDNDVVGKPKTPRQLLAEVKAMFLAENPDPRPLSYFNNSGGGAHTVVPIRWRRDAAVPSQSRLYIYNSNRPGSESDFIFIDSLANTWTDSSGLGFGTGSNKCYLEPPISTFLVGPTVDGPRSGAPLAASSGRVELSVSASADAVIRNGAGQTVGVIDSLVREDIPGAVAIIPKDGGRSLPLGYYLPGDAYTIELSDLADSTVYVSADFDSLIYSYDRVGATPAESERITLGSGLAVSNPDAGDRTVRLEATSVSATGERVAEAAGLVMTAGDSLAIKMPDTERIVLENVGDGKTYRLALKDLSPNGALRFERQNVSLAANSTHTIAPDWAGLDSIPVTIYIDTGNDGTVDDSLVVDNDLTGTGEPGNRGAGELPSSFVLEQNYPNPFNPSTTIRFAVTDFQVRRQKSEGRSGMTPGVQLVVYDLLGRTVATLVEEPMAPGWHEVVWDGRDDRGAPVASGVYLYRLQAGSFVQTRKMVLMR